MPVGSINTASTVLDRGWYMAIKQGLVPGHDIISKFGAMLVGTVLTPITVDGVWPTPSVVTSLELVSDSASDSAADVGAQEITFEGIGTGWTAVTQTIETAGLTAVPLPTDLLRINTWRVTRSGVYSQFSATGGSHVGTLTLQEAGGGALWSSLGITPAAMGRSQIACYCVPAGKTAYIISKNIYAEGGKVADIYLVQRPHADDAATPYTGILELVEREIGVAGGFGVSLKSAKGPFAGPCDVGFLGIESAATDMVSIEFEILEIDNTVL